MSEISPKIKAKIKQSLAKGIDAKVIARKLKVDVADVRRLRKHDEVKK